MPLVFKFVEDDNVLREQNHLCQNNYHFLLHPPKSVLMYNSLTNVLYWNFMHFILWNTVYYLLGLVVCAIVPYTTRHVTQIVQFFNILIVDFTKSSIKWAWQINNYQYHHFDEFGTDYVQNYIIIKYKWILL